MKSLLTDGIRVNGIKMNPKTGQMEDVYHVIVGGRVVARRFSAEAAAEEYQKRKRKEDRYRL